MPQFYPGLAPLTVITSGPSGLGLVLSSGGSDPHGVWPTPNEMVGGDKRFAVNLMAAVESLTSRTNWGAWRTIDIIGGGNYTGAHGVVALGGTWTWTPPAGAQALAASGSASSAPLVAITQNGAAVALSVIQTGAGGAATLSASSAGVAVSITNAGAGNGFNVSCAAGAGTAISGSGGGTSPGLDGTAGTTSGAPAIRSNNGPVKFTGADAISPPVAPIANACYGISFDKAAVNATGATINGTSLNIASLAVSFDPVLGSGFPSIKVTMTTPMADAFYMPMVSVLGTVGTTVRWQISGMTTSLFYLMFIDASNNPVAPSGVNYCIRVGGTQ